jgi:hypothetical protein
VIACVLLGEAGVAVAVDGALDAELADRVVAIAIDDTRLMLK